MTYTQIMDILFLKDYFDFRIGGHDATGILVEKELEVPVTG